MAEKAKNAFHTICNAVILAGLIIFVIGAYYEVVKAGIPYQDPPLELQIQYAINLGIGDERCKISLFTILYGIVFRLIIWMIERKKIKFTERNIKND